MDYGSRLFWGYPLDYYPDTTVEQLRDIFARSTGHTAEWLHLRWKGHELPLHSTMEQCGMQEQATLKATTIIPEEEVTHPLQDAAGPPPTRTGLVEPPPQLLLVLLDGSCITIDTRLDITVARLLQLAQNKPGMLLTGHGVLFNGRQPNPDDPLETRGVRSRDTLRLAFGLPGGLGGEEGMADSQTHLTQGMASTSIRDPLIMEATIG